MQTSLRNNSSTVQQTYFDRGIHNEFAFIESSTFLSFCLWFSYLSRFLPPISKFSQKLNRKFTASRFVFQLPNCGANNTDVEPSYYHALENVPVTIKVTKGTYVLCGAILFKPPTSSVDIGHYVVAAVKINDTWEVFDDMQSKSKLFSRSKKVIIHNLLYIQSTSNEWIKSIELGVSHRYRLYRL